MQEDELDELERGGHRPGAGNDVTCVSRCEILTLTHSHSNAHVGP
jgi:hypothetical protein